MRKFFGVLSALALTAAIMTSGVAPSWAAPAPEAASRAAVPAAPTVSDPFLAKVLAVANSYRAANGAGPVVWNAAISTGSQQWAATVNGRINNGTVDMNKLHRTDYGRSILPKGADMSSEIIGINNNAQQIVDWWMGSPGHRAALLDKQATDIGFGQVKTTKAGWNGMTVVVANLAGYAASRAKQPQPPPVPVANNGDVAAVDPAGNLFIYGSARGGDLWQRKFVSAGWAGTQQLEIVDFNSDGRQDIIAKWKDGLLTVSYGQANGTLKAALRIGTGWGAYDIIATKWRSADKFPGLVAKQRVTGELFYYPSPNGTGFSARTKIGTGWGPLTILGVDFDGDGRPDIAARNRTGQLLLYRGNGGGGFIYETRRVIGTGWGSMTHLSGISNHLGTNAWGVLARDGAGNLLHYPILKGRWGARSQIGSGGWAPLLLGS
ncbi:hypothetical protein CVV68_03795 [Arthrobacter livingstonensis]|uniref:SCP domain-containing protein n=1 Tax=Arthrobacter livingstonensis TaxID=670078 RepID=A0A2V5LBC2_9MICC|nr:CAP domain-containing protein [Arthrobacter livingstonensis]PYI68941.1 hypothetical protein CVV68_03795 [Arthrobacter livingstonensis]